MLLYTYGALWVRFVDLNSVKAEPVDDLGRPNAITDQLTRMAEHLGQLAAQLGLSPAAERALRHDAAPRRLVTKHTTGRGTFANYKMSLIEPLSFEMGTYARMQGHLL
jgi:hypothetical protein